MRRRATRCAAIAFSPSASAWSPANARNAASPPRKNISSCRARCARSRRCPFPFRCRFLATTDALLNDPAESLLAALRRRRGHAPQTRVSQRHGMDVDVSGFLRSARARVGFFAGSSRGGEKLSGQFGKNPERRLPRPDSRNSRRRRAAHATRLRRAGVGRHGNIPGLEAVVGVKLPNFNRFGHRFPG